MTTKTHKPTPDEQYLELVNNILETGIPKDTRAGRTLSIFGHSMRFNLQDGLPLLTTKKVYYRASIHELLWFVSGATNIKYLLDNNVHIWDDDAYRVYLDAVDSANKVSEYQIVKESKENFLKGVQEQHSFTIDKNTEYTYGDLGPVYGHQWRKWGNDQLQRIIDTLRLNPDDRRLILNAWNNEDLPKMGLPPCHMVYQFYASKNDKGKYELSCMMYQRSVDTLLGLPMNLLATALLTHMVAQCAGMGVKEMVWVGGDVHIYENQLETLKNTQLLADPTKYKSPKLKLNPDVKCIDDFVFEDFEILDYESYPAIKYPLSVGL